MTVDNKELHHYREGKVVLYMRDKYWQARLKMPTGKWHRISTKQTNLDEAAQIACERYDDVKFREKHNMALLTKKFADVARATIAELQEQLDSGYGKVTYKHYIGAIENYLIPYFGNFNIDTIDHKKLMEFDKWRIGKIGHKPKQSTINNHNSALKKVFSVALKNNWMSEYRIPDLKNTGTKTERRASFEFPEYKQLYRFMRKWHKTGKKEVTRQIRTLLRDYVLILANTGMRHGTESTRLKWKHIEEFELKGDKYLRIWVDGKTGKRELIANTYVGRYLKRIQSRFDGLKDMSFAELFKVDEYIFRTESGEQPKDWHGAFETLLRDAKLLDDKHGGRRTLYSLRHTYATFRLMRGVEIHLLANQMGTSVAMIEKHYSHLIPSLSADRIVSMKRI
jgi:site-specific recombinase XerD